MQWLQDAAASLGLAAPEPAPRPGLQKEGPLSREQLLSFFERGTELLAAEATRQKLKDARLLKQDVEDLITRMQRELFEAQGVDGAHGVAFLGQVSSVFKADSQVMAALLKFAALEEDALDEAEMPAAEYAQKQRLLELAKAHTAQLMAKLDELPVQQRQAFLQEQLAVAEQLRQQQQQGEQPQQPQGREQQGSGVSRLEDPGPSSMSQADQLKFFQSMAR